MTAKSLSRLLQAAQVACDALLQAIEHDLQDLQDEQDAEQEEDGVEPEVVNHEDAINVLETAESEAQEVCNLLADMVFEAAEDAE